MSLDRITGIAVETLAQIADELAAINLSVDLATVACDATRADTLARREAISTRLGEARISVVALRASLLRERELAA